MSDLYKLTINDTEAASKVLGKAFYNYPTFEYLFPDLNTRKRDISKVMKFLLKCGIFHGEVMASSNNLEGISIWYKSDDLNFPITSILKAGLFNLFISINKSSLYKFIKLGNEKKINRNKTIKGKYYFLDMIGVDPAHRNKGYAKLLIESKLEDIDKENIQCYLETSDINNINYYKKYDFHLIHEFSFNDYKSFCMIRESK
jgi:hypothetical protein